MIAQFVLSTRCVTAELLAQDAAHVLLQRQEARFAEKDEPGALSTGKLSLFLRLGQLQ